MFGVCQQRGIKNYFSVGGDLVAPPSGLVAKGPDVVHTQAHGPQGLEMGYSFVVLSYSAALFSPTKTCLIFLPVSFFLPSSFWTL